MAQHSSSASTLASHEVLMVQQQPSIEPTQTSSIRDIPCIVSQSHLQGTSTVTSAMGGWEPATLDSNVTVSIILDVQRPMVILQMKSVIPSPEYDTNLFIIAMYFEEFRVSQVANQHWNSAHEAYALARSFRCNDASDPIVDEPSAKGDTIDPRTEPWMIRVKMHPDNRDAIHREDMPNGRLHGPVKRFIDMLPQCESFVIWIPTSYAQLAPDLQYFHTLLQLQGSLDLQQFQGALNALQVKLNSEHARELAVKEDKVSSLTDKHQRELTAMDEKHKEELAKERVAMDEKYKQELAKERAAMDKHKLQARGTVASIHAEEVSATTGNAISSRSEVRGNKRRRVADGGIGSTYSETGDERLSELNIELEALKDELNTLKSSMLTTEDMNTRMTGVESKISGQDLKISGLESKLVGLSRWAASGPVQESTTPSASTQVDDDVIHVSSYPLISTTQRKVTTQTPPTPSQTLPNSVTDDRYPGGIEFKHGKVTVDPEQVPNSVIDAAKQVVVLYGPEIMIENRCLEQKSKRLGTIKQPGDQPILYACKYCVKHGNICVRKINGNWEAKSYWVRDPPVWM